MSGDTEMDHSPVPRFDMLLLDREPRKEYTRGRRVCLSVGHIIVTLNKLLRWLRVLCNYTGTVHIAKPLTDKMFL